MSGEPAWTEGTLLERASAGDTAAFAALVRRHQRSVYSLSLRMLADRFQAEDLAQEVFLQLYRSIRSVESETHLAFWLRRVTVNRAIDRLRREPPLSQAALSEADGLAAEPSEIDPILERRLRALLRELAPAARAVVLLRYQEDLDPTEIARTLKMPLNTVKSHLKRSLAALRERLGNEDPDGRSLASDARTLT
ncbi:MAG TPA: sigma-70 family RNA polymerase sigma factor [Steroidobacteraceae bacterium]|nr:sigma-70 family RNA polymerase sigma factor [Steroidobacteraceae bacterium]